MKHPIGIFQTQHLALKALLLGVFMIWMPLAILTSFNSSQDIDTICYLPSGTTLGHIWNLGKALGFAGEKKSFGAGIEILSISDLETSNEKVTQAVPIQEASIRIYKPYLPPFLKQTCKLKFENQELVSVQREISVD